MSSASVWLRIGDLARATDTPSDTIRYYEKIGLLSPGERSENNYRGYGPEVVKRLRFIRSCRQLDMSIAEISQMLAVKDNAHAPCDAAVAVMQEHLTHVKQRIAGLRQLQRDMTQLLQTCTGGESSDSCAVLNTLGKPPVKPRGRARSGAASGHLRATHR